MKYVCSCGKTYSIRGWYMRHLRSHSDSVQTLSSRLTRADKIILCAIEDNPYIDAANVDLPIAQYAHVSDSRLTERMTPHILVCAIAHLRRHGGGAWIYRGTEIINAINHVSQQKLMSAMIAVDPGLAYYRRTHKPMLLRMLAGRF